MCPYRLFCTWGEFRELGARFWRGNGIATRAATPVALLLLVEAALLAAPSLLLLLVCYLSPSFLSFKAAVLGFTVVFLGLALCFPSILARAMAAVPAAQGPARPALDLPRELEGKLRP